MPDPTFDQHVFSYEIDFSRRIRSTIDRVDPVRKPKIIVVDDSRAVRAVVRRGFKRAGFIVFETDRSTSALRVILCERPDALLLDLSMPGFPTMEFMKQVNEARQTHALTIKVLLYSGHASGELHEIATRYGADGYIEKTEGIIQCIAKVSDYIACAGRLTT